MSATFRTLGATLLPFALVLVSCSGTPPAATGPGATATPAGSTTQPTQPAGATATPVGGGGGGGGGGATFPDGPWAGGTAHIVISGDYNVTGDLPLAAYASLSTPETTLFQYVQADPLFSLSVAVDPASVSVVVTAVEFVGGGGTTEDAQCVVSFARAEANSVEGTVTCQNAPVISTAGVANRHVNIQASFTATR
jgi:hypothetical protein